MFIDKDLLLLVILFLRYQKDGHFTHSQRNIMIDQTLDMLDKYCQLSEEYEGHLAAQAIPLGDGGIPF